MHLQFRRALTASVLPMVCLTAFAQKTVTGTVKDASGEPLIGVTVFVDGKPGSITDIDGNFSIPNASPSSKVKISYIGYKEQTITLGNSSTINIVLQEDNAQLDEVVVVGYGTMKKSDLTGSVSSADGAKLAAKGTTSAMEALQGSVPGAQLHRLPDVQVLTSTSRSVVSLLSRVLQSLSMLSTALSAKTSAS